MHRFIKTFLLWLLLAALPLQGFAAAVQLSCGPMKHLAPASSAGMPDAHRHHDASPVHHHDAAATSATSAPAEHASMSSHAASACSACLACCVGAMALPVTTIASPVHGASMAVFPASYPLLADFIPGGLERPPKPITA